MDGKPVLVAFGPDLQRWEDPSEDLLYMLLEDLMRAGPDGGMLVQRLDVSDEQCLFIMRVEESFAMLRKDGEEAVAAVTVSLKELRRLYALGIPGRRSDRREPTGSVGRVYRDAGLAPCDR